MMSRPIVRALAACNGGPGLTAGELADEFGQPEAQMRATLADLVFRAGEVTCDRDGRYKLGDPTALMEMRS